MESSVKRVPENKLMISYSWGYKKETLNVLYKFLVDKGYDVWKDDEGWSFYLKFSERTSESQAAISG